MLTVTDAAGHRSALVYRTDTPDDVTIRLGLASNADTPALDYQRPGAETCEYAGTTALLLDDTWLHYLGTGRLMVRALMVDFSSSSADASTADAYYMRAGLTAGAMVGLL